MFWTILLLACAAVTVTAWAATWAMLRILIRFRIYDQPNHRSSHSQPKPRGGGLALIPILLLAWIAADLWLGMAPSGFWLVVPGAALLALVSWLDDLRSLPASLRLIVQLGPVALGLAGLDESIQICPVLLPTILDRLVAGLFWLWFINLFNFMDGIDGISGVEASSIGVGLVLAGALAGWPAESAALPALLAAATLGFLAWNWAPSKLFLGDAGSVPLGYLLGWLLITAATNGQWAVALILPLYYLADATITLAKRLLRGAKIWQAHREHFYQRAVQGGSSHARVATQVLACNAVLILAAGAAVLGFIWPAILAAILAVAVLLIIFERRARSAI